VLKPSLQLAFDDVWLEPQYSEIISRADPDLSSNLSDYCRLSHPVIATNMASVVGEKMAMTFDQSGSLAFHHRFLPRETLCLYAENFIHHNLANIFAFSVGIKNEDLECAKEVFDTVGEKSVILVDIAHAHTKMMGEFIDKIKSIGFETLVAGNVATPEGYQFLIEHGADAVRVGIAGGKVCTTKYVTGHYIPTLQSVIDIQNFRKNNSYNTPIIADGGISSSGDAAKALAAGADFVCIGSVLAATSDSPSELIHEPNGASYKLHYGMSSRTAIEKFFEGKKRHVAPEGKAERMPYAGETKDILNEFLAGIRSAFTYTGAISLKEFQNKAILRCKSN
jgi:IMP dehydrogenase